MLIVLVNGPKTLLQKVLSRVLHLGTKLLQPPLSTSSEILGLAMKDLRYMHTLSRHMPFETTHIQEGLSLDIKYLCGS